MKYLALIPARGESKGLPKKNIKLLAGKPLIHYTIEAARSIFVDHDICVSTDSEEIKQVVELTGLRVPFLRPADLATDTANTQEVMLHAIAFYRAMGKQYEALVLLQPTSPLRNAQHINEALSLFSLDVDRLVSVKRTKANPYFVLFEENEQGFLDPSKKGDFTRRQDCPVVYELNGAIYIYNIKALEKGTFKRTVKYLMDSNVSADIDTIWDWKWIEILMESSDL